MNKFKPQILVLFFAFFSLSANFAYANLVDTPVQRAMYKTWLGKNISKFDAQFGKPEKIIGNSHFYKITNCKIEIETNRKKIETLSLHINEKCSLNIGQYMPSMAIQNQLNQMTFSNVNGGDFASNCLINCKNSKAPIIFSSLRGDNIDEDYIAVFYKTLSEKDEINAAKEFEKQLIKQYGDEYENKWICASSARSLGFYYFANVKIDKIKFYKAQNNSKNEFMKTIKNCN